MIVPNTGGLARNEIRRSSAQQRCTEAAVLHAEAVGMFHTQSDLRINSSSDPGMQLTARFPDIDIARYAHRLATHLWGIDLTMLPSSASTTSLHAGKITDHQAARAELVDRFGRRTEGIPARIVRGPLEQTTAVLRGAFLGSGSIATRRSGMSADLVIECQRLAPAMALRGFMRRHGMHAVRLHERADGTQQVIASSPTEIAQLLRAIGAPDTAQSLLDGIAALVSRHERGPSKEKFANANSLRAEQAAAVAVERTREALSVLDADSIPTVTLIVARSRIENPLASLAEIGAACQPPVSKDVAASRLRSLLRKLDQVAPEHRAAV